MNELLRLVFSLSLGGSLMALLILGIRLTLGKRLPSAFYYYALVLVLLRLIMPLPGFMKLDRGADISGQTAVTETVSRTQAQSYSVSNGNLPRVSQAQGNVGGYVGASQVSPVSSAQAEDESAGSLSLSKLVIGLIGASLSYALALVKERQILVCALGSWGGWNHGVVSGRLSAL
jgi:hypothetical protein